MKSNWVKIVNKHINLIFIEYIIFKFEYMSKSKFVIDKLAKLFEQGLVSYKDLTFEMINILKSKRDEIIFRMKLTGKEETDIINKRLENLEKKVEYLEKNKLKKVKKARRS